MLKNLNAQRAKLYNHLKVFISVYFLIFYLLKNQHFPNKITKASKRNLGGISEATRRQPEVFGAFWGNLGLIKKIGNSIK